VNGRIDMALKLGQWNAICDVCGFKLKSGKMRKRWDDLYVCDEDWEPRHPLDFMRAPPNKEKPIPWSRPEVYPVYVEVIEGDVIIEEE